MKITALNERVQGFYAIHKVENDGEVTITYQPDRWHWAKITPKSNTDRLTRSQTEPHQNRYEVVMHKEDVCNTRHAYLSRLRWNHKLLDIYTPWLEIQGMNYVSGLALMKIEGEQYG